MKWVGKCDLKEDCHGEDHRCEGQEDGRLLRSPRLIDLGALARELERLALGPDALTSAVAFPWSTATVATLIKARRLRVLEWLASSGFYLLNVIESVERDFLTCVQASGAEDKLVIAERLWHRLATRLDARANEVARLELLLLHARLDVKSSTPAAPGADGDAWTLSKDVRLTRIDHRAYAVHESLPAYDVPHDERPRLLDAALAPLSGELVPQPVAALPASDGADGAILLLDDPVGVALERLRAVPATRSTLATWMPADAVDALIDVGAICKVSA